MAHMHATMGQDTNTPSAASSSSISLAPSSSPRRTVTVLPVARINSPQPDNRINLARAMYRLSDYVAHLRAHYQATMPQEDPSEEGKMVPRSGQTSEEFKLWVGLTRYGAIQALYVKSRTQVAVQLPGFGSRRSRVLGEFPSHFKEYVWLFCFNIATAARVKYSIVHDLSFAMGLKNRILLDGGEDAADKDMGVESEGDALEVAAMQMFAFPNAYWAVCVAVATPVVLIEIEA